MDSLTQLTLGAAVGVAVMGRRTAVWKAALWGGVCGTLPDLDALLDHGNPVLNMVRQQHAQAQNAPHEPRGPRREEGMWVDKNMKPDKLNGTTSFSNWGDDVKAIVGARKPAYQELVTWAEEWKDESISQEEVE